MQVEVQFRGADFTIRVEVEDELLLVEICDSITADQWRGEFDPAYIEDLTRKTGNFKQFSVFCSMLESAVTKTSEAVTLDLLTYSDLELLRNRKMGLASKSRPQPPSPAVSAKRYLILVYTVEFDRIHYPLPLPYQGKPDPAALQREIRALKAELAALGVQGKRITQDTEVSRLRTELARVRGEKDALSHALEQLQVGRTPAGGARGLRDVVQSLEEQLLRERAKNQRSASKRSQEKRLLLEQLEELQASERALRIKVKSLTNELALVQRSRASPLAFGRSSSREDGRGRRSVSRERSLGGGLPRARSGSRDRMEERTRRAGSTGSRPRVPRPSPSPSGSRPRFDPTSYIQDRQRRQKEAELKNQRKVRRAMLSPLTNMERGRSRSRELQFTRMANGGRARSSSLESRRSGHFSDTSLVDVHEISKPLPSKTRKPPCKSSTVAMVSIRGGGQGAKNPGGRNQTKKLLCSTPTYNSRSLEKECADLSEIDARLQALQDYMRELDTGR